MTAFLVAPFLFWRQQGGLDGFWGHPAGPLHYMWSNWAVAPRQNDVSGVIAASRESGLAHSPSFDAALWSLRYEVLCYVGVAILALTGVLARARRVVLLLVAVLGWLILQDALSAPFWAGFDDSSYATSFTFVEMTGKFDPDLILYLAFAFSIGTLIEVYRERIPVSDVLGVASAVVMITTLHYGYFFVLGLPAFAYLLVWLAIRLPAPFRRVASRNDFSYGIYIYGFVVQQALVALGGARWGFWPFLVMSLVGSVGVAALSWHLVERPAMKLKDFGRSRPEPATVPPSVPGAGATDTPRPEPEQAGALPAGPTRTPAGATAGRTTKQPDAPSNPSTAGPERELTDSRSSAG